MPCILCYIGYHRACNQSNTAGSTSVERTAHTSAACEFTLEFQRGSCCLIFRFLLRVCRSLFFQLSIFFWPLCLLSFDLWITTLVSSNSSYKYIRYTLYHSILQYITHLFLQVLRSQQQNTMWSNIILMIPQRHDVRTFITILFTFPLMFITNVSYHVSAEMISIITNRCQKTRSNIAVL